MTLALSGEEVAAKLEQQFPASVVESTNDNLLIKKQELFNVISFLKNTPEFGFNYLVCMSGVDYFDYFEIVYHLVSVVHNHSIVVKTRCYGRENLSVPSITGLFKGANAQEREIYDLLGVRFENHPNMKRLFLWDGFQGHPLRKDFI
jgi:NADH-quinone oxidoreductase subunit C